MYLQELKASVLPGRSTRKRNEGSASQHRKRKRTLLVYQWRQISAGPIPTASLFVMFSLGVVGTVIFPRWSDNDATLPAQESLCPRSRDICARNANIRSSQGNPRNLQHEQLSISFEISPKTPICAIKRYGAEYESIHTHPEYFLLYYPDFNTSIATRISSCVVILIPS